MIGFCHRLLSSKQARNIELPKNACAVLSPHSPILTFPFPSFVPFLGLLNPSCPRAADDPPGEVPGPVQGTSALLVHPAAAADDLAVPPQDLHKLFAKGAHEAVDHEAAGGVQGQDEVVEIAAELERFDREWNEADTL